MHRQNKRDLIVAITHDVSNVVSCGHDADIRLTFGTLNAHIISMVSRVGGEMIVHSAALLNISRNGNAGNFSVA